MSTPAAIVFIVVTLLTAGSIFRLFFEDRDDFFKCLGSALTPEVISLFRGELLEDWRRSWRLGLYFLVASIPGMILGFAVDELIGLFGSGNPPDVPF